MVLEIDVNFFRWGAGVAHLVQLLVCGMDDRRFGIRFTARADIFLFLT
jgi:hypothetical protein